MDKFATNIGNQLRHISLECFRFLVSSLGSPSTARMRRSIPLCLRICNLFNRQFRIVANRIELGKQISAMKSLNQRLTEAHRSTIYLHLWTESIFPSSYAAATRIDDANCEKIGIEYPVVAAHGNNDDTIVTILVRFHIAFFLAWAYLVRLSVEGRPLYVCVWDRLPKHVYRL